MSLGTVATVFDVANEFLAQSGAVFTLFNNSNVASGVIYSKIQEANASLQGWTGVGGPSSNPSVLGNQWVKQYEVQYAAGVLAANLAGLTITDGFNVTAQGLAISRQGAQQKTYEDFIRNHLMIAKEYMKMLHPWFFVYNSAQPQGFDEYGNPVSYWDVSQARDFGG